MIDTIVLRVHNLQKNQNLIKSLKIAHVEGYSSETGTVDQDELFKLMKQGHKSKEMIKILKWKKSGEFLVKTEVGKQVNTSAHYQFTWFVNYTQDYVEFNFSIPKFKFGTNILLFIRHNYDNRYVFHEGISLEHNLKVAHPLLISFIQKFFRWEFLFGYHVDLKDVEINRIDICFNQVFRSKEDALLTLEYQKRLKKKYARNEDGVMKEYATSMMYVTRRYSAKIYHKGTEYEKHDKKEHKKFNEKKGTRYFDTEKYQKFSDRILRYEMTFRHTYLNYLHKSKLFRRKCSLWKSLYDQYLLVEIGKQSNDRIARKVGTLKTDEEKQKYMLAHPYTFPSKLAKQSHKQVEKIISRKRYFMAASTMDSDIFNARTVTYNDDRVLFSPQLMELLTSKFMSFVKEFQIKHLPGEDIVRQRILQYNEMHPRGFLPINEMLSFYSLLQKHGSFKEAMKFSRFSRATNYRYIDRFDKIQINDKHIRPVDKSFGIPKAPLDLRDYQISVNENGFLKGIKATAATSI